METWRVVVDGKKPGQHTERFVEVKGFAELAKAIKLRPGEAVKLAQRVG